MNDKIFDYTFAAFVGAFIGGVHGAILWATMNTGAVLVSNGTETFIPASYYNNTGFYQLAIEVALLVDIAALVTVLSSGWWLPRLMQFHEDFMISRYGDDDKEGEI